MFAFVHIPKTAGTSVKRQLIESPGLRVLNVTNQKTFDTQFSEDADKLRAQSADYDCLVGHIVYRKWWVPGVSGIVSVLREPVARAVSLTNFIRSTPENELNKVILEMGFKTAFAENPRFRNLLSNSQYRALLGGNDKQAAQELAGRSQSETDAHFAELFSRYAYTVGTIENFSTFLDHLNGQFDLNLSAGVVKKTRDKTDDYVFDDEDLEQIKANNTVDALLHDYVARHRIIAT